MNLTEHFSTEEFERSETAEKHGIDNTMPPEAIEAARLLCINVLEPLRARVKRPIVISSGYRCPALNGHKDVGGAADSQHVKAEAVDFTIVGLSVEEAFNIVWEEIPFDQVIQEHGEWVHVSYRAFPRRQALRAYRIIDEKTGKKKTKYLRA